MNYEGQICRAPMERASFMLPVMVGCSYNGCKFCNLFRHLKYRVLSMEVIENELKRVKECNGSPKKIFLGDGNAFDLPTDHLLSILKMIRDYFPKCEMVNMDATVTGILKKTDEELKTLYDCGVRHLYLGIETGLNDVLVFMNKDHNLSQAYEAIERIQNVGMIYDAHIMTGVAGKGRSMENAEALAAFLKETRPAHVVNFSMFMHNEVPLYKEVAKGTFEQADELECIKEERRIVELLADSETPIVYDGFHDFIEFRVRGTVPKDCGKMLKKLDEAIAHYEEEEPIYSRVYGQCPNLQRCDNGADVWENPTYICNDLDKSFKCDTISKD